MTAAESRRPYADVIAAELALQKSRGNLRTAIRAARRGRAWPPREWPKTIGSISRATGLSRGTVRAFLAQAEAKELRKP